MKTDSGDQQPDMLDTPEQAKVNMIFQSKLKKGRGIQNCDFLASIFLTKDLIDWHMFSKN